MGSIQMQNIAHFSIQIILLPLLLFHLSPFIINTIFCAETPVGKSNSRIRNDPWTPDVIDQLRPYKLAEKRVHEQPGISWKSRHDRQLSSQSTRALNPSSNNETKLSPEWRMAEPEQSKLLKQVPTISPHGDFSFMANQTLLHLRTPTYWLRHNQCLEVHFRVEGKRTRLLLYTCRMYEGGICVLDKFLATTAVKKLDPAGQSELDICHKMQPWMFLPSPFAFHFRFVRRPRKFADREAEMRHFRRRHGRHATREVGRVHLTGFHPCNAACKGQNGTELTDIQKTPHQDQHFEDPLEGWGKRRR